MFTFSGPSTLGYVGNSNSLGPAGPDDGSYWLSNLYGHYGGDPHSRDSAYHQGTVWPWLLGPFLTAYVRVHGSSAEARDRARRFIEPLRGHLWQAGVGQISELFDGDPPHRPAGCIAQAWSVAEVLRTYVEDAKGMKPVFHMAGGAETS